jgi:hypothetical protein
MLGCYDDARLCGPAGSDASLSATASGQLDAPRQGADAASSGAPRHSGGEGTSEDACLKGELGKRPSDPGVADGASERPRAADGAIVPMPLGLPRARLRMKEGPCPFRADAVEPQRRG